MLFWHLLTDTAQIFADVRTFWSPDAVKRVTGYSLEGDSESGIMHLTNSGAACLDGTGQQEINGSPALKPYWEITDEEAKKCLASSRFRPASVEYFRGCILKLQLQELVYEPRKSIFLQSSFFFR